MFKKLPLVLLIVLIVCAVAPCVASAESAELQHTSTYKTKHYTLTTITQSNQPMGVRFGGLYFGSSGIEVSVEIYSSPQLELNFYIGDQDADTANPAPDKAILTEAQTATKRTVLSLAERFDEYINSVDACANTQYDGQNSLPLSDVYRYNNAQKGERLEISQLTYDMLLTARQMYGDTSGAFNPAVYRLVDLWGFSSRIYQNGDFHLPYDRTVTSKEFAENGYPLPDRKYIVAFSDAAFVDFSESAVILEHTSEGNGDSWFVTKNVQPAVVDGVEYQQWIDLGGIAKGFVADGIKQILQENSLDRYYIDSGGSSGVFGNTASGNDFAMQIADPYNKDAQFWALPLLQFDVGKSSSSTSGQYVRKYTTNGVEYAHILDASTGAPAQTGVKSVSVSVPESEGNWAGKADCLTTALTVMGRDKIVEFCNGYLKNHNIKVAVVYETLDGKKQILSNIPNGDIEFLSDNAEDYIWAVSADEKGNFYYDENADFAVTDNSYTTLLIVLGSLVLAAVVAVVVYQFARGNKKALKNVQHARNDKIFKAGDVMVYLLVVLVVAALFAAIFGGIDSQNWNTLQVVDMGSGEQLFFLNVARKEYRVNTQNANGWDISVKDDANGWEVTFSRVIEGEMHFNTMRIKNGATPTVQMTDSLCGFHQDCIYNFGEVDKVGGAIVCSPNHLKVTTE